MPQTVGEAILTGAQAIVAQFQAQQQIQLHQLAFQQQVETQEKDFQLRERTLKAQERLQAIQFETQQLELKAAQQRQAAFEALGGVKGEIERQQQTQELKAQESQLEFATKEANLGIAQANLAKTQVESKSGGLPPTKLQEMKEGILKAAGEMNERNVVSGVVQQKVTDDGRYAAFSQMTVREIAQMRNNFTNPNVSLDIQLQMLAGINFKAREANSGVKPMTLPDAIAIMTDLIDTASPLAAAGPDENTKRLVAEQAFGVVGGQYDTLVAGGAFKSSDDYLIEMLPKEQATDPIKRARAHNVVRAGNVAEFANEFMAGLFAYDGVGRVTMLAEKKNAIANFVATVEPDPERQLRFMKGVIDYLQKKR